MDYPKMFDMENEEKKFNLVLSGGGVKGFAHIGLLKALEEVGLIPSAVSGTSFGAIVGAYHCAGYTADDMYTKLKNAKFIDPLSITLRKAGLINIEKLTEFYKQDFPENSFEALKKKLYVTSSDMNNNRAVIHQEGELIIKVLASACVPGVYAPVSINGELHMDGGITCNFPSEPFVDSKEPTIGSYVCFVSEREQAEINTTIRLMIRSSQIMLWHMSKPKFKQMDYLFCPKALSNVAFFDPRKIEEAFQLGYSAAKEEIKMIENKIKGPLTA